jgi:hypothetical protein
MHLPLRLTIAPLIFQRRPHRLEVGSEPVGEANELRYLAPERIDQPLTQPIGASLFDDLGEAKR